MIKYIAESVEWRDKVNGNTYASTRIIATETGEVIKVFPYSHNDELANAALSWLNTRLKEKVQP